MIVIGLYHRYGRLFTYLKKTLRYYLPRPQTSKQQAWHLDQYYHPHESTHTIEEVDAWIKSAGLDFLRVIPGEGFSSRFSRQDDLLRPDIRPSKFERRLREKSFAFTAARDGGLFVTVARKPAEWIKAQSMNRWRKQTPLKNGPLDKKRSLIKGPLKRSPDYF